MAYWAGIDLGTTFTAAAVMVGDRPEMITLSSTSTSIPSVVALKPDGTWLVGRSANQRASSEPDRVAREFKRRIGDPVPILVGGTPFPAQDLSTVLLEAVLEIVEQRMGGKPEGIAVTHPASWGPYRLDVFRAAIKSVSPYAVKFVSEPLGAAVHYAVKERIDEGDIVCVYDLGGGTFDAALLKRTETGFTQIGEPLGMDQFGGIDVDAALQAMVIGALPRELADLDTEEPAVIAGYSGIQKQIAPAKIALSSDTDTSVAINLPGYSSAVRINRSEFEAAIRPRLEQTIDVVSDMIARASLTPEDISRVLLVGGSSRIPLVSQLLAERLARPISVDADPKHSIVLGAVTLAAGKAGTTKPTKPAPVEPAASPTEEPKAVGSLFPDLPDGPLPEGALPFGRKTPPATAPPPTTQPIQTTPSQPAPPPAGAPTEQAPLSPPPNHARPQPAPATPPPRTPAPAAPVPAAPVPAAPAATMATPQVAPRATNYPPATEPKPGKGKFVLLALLMVAAIGGGTFAYLNYFGSDDETATPTPTTAEAGPGTTDETPTSEAVPSSTTSEAPVERAPIALLENLTLGSKPWKPAIVDDRVFVSMSGENKVKVYDASSFGLIGEIPVGDRPASPVVSPGKVWVLNAGTNTISVIDSQSLTLVQTITVGSKPNYAVVAEGRLWVSNTGSGDMSIIDLDTGTVLDTIAIGATPGRGEIVGSSLYVSAQGDNSVVVVDMATLATSPIAVESEPLNVLFALDRVWVANLRSSSVSVIDPSSKTVVGTIAVGELPLPGIEAGGKIWIPNRGSDSISIIDPATLSVENVLETGSKPGTPMVTKDRVFISNYASGDVTVIDVPAQFVVGTVPVGEGTDTGVLDNNNQLWIVAIDNGTATVITPG